MQLIQSMPDILLDCCITDPPYGISYQSAWRTDKSKWKPKIANDETPYTEWIKPLYAKMKDGGRLICFYRWDVQDEFLEAIKEAGFTVKSQIVWDKVIHGMGDLRGEFAPQHELMIYATKGRFEFSSTRPKTVYRTMRVKPDILVHPNEKPVNLLQAIIRDISTKGELIYDPFSGSGSTLLACQQEKRNFIGSELSESYCEIINRRLINYSSDLSLFAA
jgi:site-specific DNA-methyltransferase (adenine-specific)